MGLIKWKILLAIYEGRIGGIICIKDTKLAEICALELNSKYNKFII